MHKIAIIKWAFVVVIILLTMPFANALEYTTVADVFHDFSTTHNSECVYSTTTETIIGDVNATVDDVRLYDRILSVSEVNASYNAGLYRLYNNFTGLADGTYTYTAYAQDLAGNTNNTETRTITIYTETYGDEIFPDNVYSDEYETANVTLYLNSDFSGTNQTYYTIPFDISLVNTSSIAVSNSTSGNITFTRTNNNLNFTIDGTQDPYYITYDVKAVKKMTVSEYGSCPLYYTSHTTYCSREVVVTPGSLSTYYYRYYLNVTRNETNSSHILHNQSTSIFTSFATRDNLTVRVDDSSTNTTPSVIGTTLQYNITNEHQAGSLYSLNEGTYYIDVWYNVVTGTPAGGGGGGGGGGGTVGDGVNTTGECIIDSDCYNIYGYSKRYCVNTSCSATHGFDCWADKDCIYKYGIKKPYCVKNDCKSASEIECWYNSDCIAKYGDLKAYCINYECTSSKDTLSFEVYPREIEVETIVGDTERYQIRVMNYASEPFAFTLEMDGNHAEWISIPNHQTLWNIDPLKSVTFSIDVIMKEPVHNEMSVLRVKAKRELSTDVKELPINFNAIEGKELGVFCDSDVECLSKSCINAMCASYNTHPDSQESHKENKLWMYLVGAGILGGLILFLSWILSPKATKD